MATFRCKRSGNTISINDENDIKVMRTHESYEELKNEAHADEAVKVQEAAETQVLKRRGRPPKRE